MTEWSLWARPDLAARGRRLVVPRTDLTQFPRDVFPFPEDVRAAAPKMLLALLEQPDSVNMPERPYAFRGWVWIGRANEDRPPDPDRRKPSLVGIPVRLDGSAIETKIYGRSVVLGLGLAVSDPLLDPSALRTSARWVASRAVSTLVEGWTS
jgi:hypothetical protein